jgi:hypothetical protein
MMLISGFTGEHPVRHIESSAIAPYPCAGNLKINGVWLSDAPHLFEAVDQAYDFSCAELTTRFKFSVGEVGAQVAVLTFCDRVEPTLVCQETALVVDADCEVELRVIVEAGSRPRNRPVNVAFQFRLQERPHGRDRACQPSSRRKRQDRHEASKHVDLDASPDLRRGLRA